MPRNWTSKKLDSGVVEIVDDSGHYLLSCYGKYADQTAIFILKAVNEFEKLVNLQGEVQGVATNLREFLLELRGTKQ